MKERYTEIWIRSYNHRTMETHTVAYYASSDDSVGDTDMHEILKDLQANQYEVEKIEYIKKGSVDMFEIIVS